MKTIRVKVYKFVEIGKVAKYDLAGSVTTPLDQVVAVENIVNSPFKKHNEHPLLHLKNGLTYRIDESGHSEILEAWKS